MSTSTATSTTTSATTTSSANTAPLIAISVPNDKADIVQNVHMFFAPRVWSIIYNHSPKREWRDSNDDCVHALSDHIIAISVEGKSWNYPVGRVVTATNVKNVDRLKQMFAELETFIRADDKAQDELMAKVSLTFSPEAVESRRGPVVQYHVERVPVIVKDGERKIFISARVFDFVRDNRETWRASNGIHLKMGSWTLEWNRSLCSLYLSSGFRDNIRKLPDTLSDADFVKVKEALVELAATVRAAPPNVSNQELAGMIGL